MNENNSIIDVYLQIMEEYDRDLKLFKGTGVTIDSIRKDLYSQVENKTTTENKVVEFPINELKPDEIPQKVGVDGAVTLDSEPVPQF